MSSSHPSVRPHALVLRALLACLCVLVASLTLVGPADAAHRLSAPTGLRTGAPTATTLTVRWTAPRGAKAFRVQYSTSATMRGARSLRTRRAAGRLTGLRAASRYYVRVQVVDRRTGRALSAFTRAASGRTFAPAAPSTPPPTAPSATPIVWPASTPAPGASIGQAPVRVASFNVFGVNNDAKSTADMRPWRERRAVVAAQILREQVDVVGLQEANQSTIYGSSLDYGTTQYGDLRGAVNAAGAHYAVTNEASYNCLRENSNQGCVPTYRGASNSTRILYNTDTLDLLAQGSMKYAAQSAGHIDRYLAWGVFRVRATGGEFLFVDTHLDSYDTTVRVAQWRELIDRVNALQNGRPVVAVGDFNTSKFSAWAAQMLPAMEHAGYGDVLNQQYANPNAVSPRAQNRVDAWISSFHGFSRTVAGYSKYQGSRIGNNIDWVFATNGLTVTDWKTVVDHDPSTLQITGVIPSDHAMVAATLLIP